MQDNTDDSTLRRLLRNAGYLLGSRVLRDGMGLVALALVARHLGPGGFGVIALLQSYTFTINWLVNFQTWQAIIRYGASLEGEQERPALRGPAEAVLAPRRRYSPRRGSDRYLPRWMDRADVGLGLRDDPTGSVVLRTRHHPRLDRHVDGDPATV